MDELMAELQEVADGRTTTTRERLLEVSGLLSEALAGKLTEGGARVLWERLRAAEKHVAPRRMADAILGAVRGLP